MVWLPFPDNCLDFAFDFAKICVQIFEFVVNFKTEDCESVFPYHIKVFAYLISTLVMSRLHERPDNWWKCCMYLVAFLRLFSVRSMKSVVSSANVSARDSSVAYVMPVMFFVVVILISKISTMIIKMYGESISPCLTPLDTLNLSE